MTHPRNEPAMLEGWHWFQHAYYDAPRDRRGRIVGMVPGVAGTVLRAMRDLLGYCPHLPVPYPNGQCRVCLHWEITPDVAAAIERTLEAHAVPPHPRHTGAVPR